MFLAGGVTFFQSFRIQFLAAVAASNTKCFIFEFTFSKVTSPSNQILGSASRTCPQTQEVTAMIWVQYGFKQVQLHSMCTRVPTEMVHLWHWSDMSFPNLLNLYGVKYVLWKILNWICLCLEDTNFVCANSNNLFQFSSV